MIIYKITNNINNKVYIGLTTTSLQHRWRAHLAMCGKADKHLYQSMKKYGKENFSIEQIDEADTIQELGEKERYYIKLYDSTNPAIGYNLTAGGEHNQLDANPKAKLSIDDVINIRLIYRDAKLTCKEAYQQYKDKIKYGPFERCFEGHSWSSIMPEVFNDSTKALHYQLRGHSGSKNGNSRYTDDEVMTIREYYTSHTLEETFNKFSKGSCKSSFLRVIKRSYTNLPMVEVKPYRRIGKPRGPYKKK